MYRSGWWKLEKSLDFFERCLCSTCNGFRGFAARQLVDGSLCSSSCNIHRLVNECIDQTCDWIIKLMFHFEKGVTVFGFHRFSSFIYVWRNWSFKPPYRTTGVEVIYWTLTAVLFKAGANNSYKSFAVTNLRKNFLSFRSCKIYISLLRKTCFIEFSSLISTMI